MHHSAWQSKKSDKRLLPLWGASSVTTTYLGSMCELPSCLVEMINILPCHLWLALVTVVLAKGWGTRIYWQCPSVWGHDTLWSRSMDYQPRWCPEFWCALFTSCASIVEWLDVIGDTRWVYEVLPSISNKATIINTYVHHRNCGPIPCELQISAKRTNSCQPNPKAWIYVWEEPDPKKLNSNLILTRLGTP